jgi:carbonyl reductase 1
MTAQRIALVTGANQGIGCALVEGLAARWSPHDLILLTGRNQSRVNKAAARAARASATVASVEGRRLDVTDADAVARMAGELSEQYGGIDVLDERLHPLLENASLDEVESAAESWRAAIHAGTGRDLGWPQWINVPSKVAQVAAVRAVARQRRATDLRNGTLIAAVCPGLVDTATSRPWFADFSQARTPAQAAAAVLDFVLAEPADLATYGELVRDGKVLPWLSGTPAGTQATPAN